MRTQHENQINCELKLHTKKDKRKKETKKKHLLGVVVVLVQRLLPPLVQLVPRGALRHGRIVQVGVDAINVFINLCVCVCDGRTNELFTQKESWRLVQRIRKTRAGFFNIEIFFGTMRRKSCREKGVALRRSARLSTCLHLPRLGYKCS